MTFLNVAYAQQMDKLLLIEKNVFDIFLRKIFLISVSIDTYKALTTIIIDDLITLIIYSHHVDLCSISNHEYNYVT